MLPDSASIFLILAGLVIAAFLIVLELRSPGEGGG